MSTLKHKLPAIETAGRPAKRAMRDLLPPSAAELRDIARPVPAYAVTPHVPARPLGSGGYSGAVVAAYGRENVSRLVRS